MPPAIRTTVVGSYPVPDWLKSHPNEEALADAIAVAVHAQAAAGLDLISDGELSRWDLRRNAPGGMVERFVRQMGGVRAELTRRDRQAFAAAAGSAYRADPPGVVTGPLSDGSLDLPREWRRARSVARGVSPAPLKFTLTSPYMMAKLLVNEHYAGVADLAMALADVLAGQVSGVDADVIQVDEPNLPGSPADAPLAAAAINHVLDAAAGAAAGAARSTAVHLCFGNYGGQTIQRGDYGRLVGFLDALRCDHAVLETVRRPAEELRRLRDVRPSMRFGLGVIDVKDLQVETADQVARRIESLAELVGADRLAYVNPDCGLRMLPRPVADAKMRALVAGRDLYQGGSGSRERAEVGGA